MMRYDGSICGKVYYNCLRDNKKASRGKLLLIVKARMYYGAC